MKSKSTLIIVSLVALVLVLLIKGVNININIQYDSAKMQTSVEAAVFSALDEVYGSRDQEMLFIIPGANHSGQSFQFEPYQDYPQFFGNTQDQATELFIAPLPPGVTDEDISEKLIGPSIQDLLRQRRKDAATLDEEVADIPDPE